MRISRALDEAAVGNVGKGRFLLLVVGRLREADDAVLRHQVEVALVDEAGEDRPLGGLVTGWTVARARADVHLISARQAERVVGRVFHVVALALLIDVAHWWPV